MLLEIFLWVREYPLVHIFDVDIMELHIVVACEWVQSQR